MNRRAFLTRSAAAAAGAALSMPFIGRARAADRLTVMSPFGFTPEFSDLINAYSAGYYRKHGIDATVLATHGVQSMQQLVAGRVQIIRNTVPDLIRSVHQQSLHLVSIGTLTQQSAFIMISAAGKPVKDVQDLKGKTIGIQGPLGGASSVYITLMCKHNNVPLDSFTMQTVGNSVGSYELVKQGRIDCFVGGPDTLNKLKRANEAVEAWSTDRYVKIPSQIYVTTSDFANANEDLLKRFMAAIRESVNEMLTGSLEQIFTREAKDFEMSGLQNMEEAIESEKTFFPLWLAEGKENLLRNVPERWATAARLMQEAGLGGSQPPETYYDNRYIDASA